MRHLLRPFVALCLAAGLGLAAPGSRADDMPAAETAPAKDAVSSPTPTPANKPAAKSAAKPAPATTSQPVKSPTAKPAVVRGSPAPANANAAVNKTAAVGAAGKSPAVPAAAKKSAKPIEPAAALKPLLSEQDRAVYKEAFARATDGKWAEAQKAAARAKEKLPAKLLRALELGAGGDFAAITQFIAANPDWPFLGPMRQRAEEAVAGQSDQVQLDWFQNNPPQGLRGQKTR